MRHRIIASIGILIEIICITRTWCDGIGTQEPLGLEIIVTRPYLIRIGYINTIWSVCRLIVFPFDIF